jgi:hypothetical protein
MTRIAPISSSLKLKRIGTNPVGVADWFYAIKTSKGAGPEGSAPFAFRVPKISFF